MRRRRKTFGKWNVIGSWLSKLKRRIMQFNECFIMDRPKVA